MNRKRSKKRVHKSSQVNRIRKNKKKELANKTIIRNMMNIRKFKNENIIDDPLLLNFFKKNKYALECIL